jgi:hypothetical protein
VLRAERADSSLFWGKNPENIRNILSPIIRLTVLPECRSARQFPFAFSCIIIFGSYNFHPFFPAIDNGGRVR